MRDFPRWLAIICLTLAFSILAAAILHREQAKGPKRFWDMTWKDTR